MRWYHFGMAMTVRLPEELDAQLEAIARARHTSKHAVIIEAATRFANSESKTDRVLSIADEVTERYAETLKRLEDA
ncbi:hypothetical protein CVS53_03626 [Microbacterium oxydans]|nr:hypothetical protein CVS53_03626 [Microbacterium oxydans]